MRYAIISDIHANWQAWSAVRDEIHRLGPDTMVCLGDIVGYGPSPTRVFADLVANCENLVLGNHDAAVAGGLDLDMFNDQARRSTLWTAGQFKPEELERLGSAPLVLEAEDILFVHAETPSPDEFGYVETEEDARACFAATDARFIFIGHTHIPLVFALRADGTISVSREQVTPAEPGVRYLVNVGSVGDPGDGSVLASYCVFDSTTGEINLRKVAFDVAAFRAELDRIPKLPLSWFLQKHEAETARPVYDQAVAVGKVARAKIRVPSSRARIQVYAGALTPRADVTRRDAKKTTTAKKPNGSKVGVMAASIFVLIVGTFAGMYLLANRDLPARVPGASRPSAPPAPQPAAAARIAPRPDVPASSAVAKPVAWTPRSLDAPVVTKAESHGSHNLPGQIAEAKDYRLVYDLDLAKLSAAITYDADLSATAARFDRVAYLIELRKAEEPAHFLWVSMDAFTTDAAKLGVPTFESGAVFQKSVDNITVFSSMPGIATGERIGSGNIEFWASNYDKKNSANVPGASNTDFDFGDNQSGQGDYGSMQVHRPAAKQTLFAINHWCKGGAGADLGIGNSDNNSRGSRCFDWTFSGNGGTYSSKRLRVFVRPAP